MSSSSSTVRSKSSDKQSNEASETVYESNSIKLTIPFGKKIERPVKQSYHFQILPPPPDQSKKHSPHVRSKRSLASFGASPLQSNFFSHSSASRLNARPFEEIAIGKPSSDVQNGTTIKTDGNPSPWTDKKS